MFIKIHPNIELDKQQIQFQDDEKLNPISFFLRTLVDETLSERAS